jgi:diphosphomevalonate decarboxylase
MNNSLSISLGRWGTQTRLTVIEKKEDEVFFNKQRVNLKTPFATRLITFLNLLNQNAARCRYRIESINNLPLAAGFASSASGFAALTLSLSQLYNWHLTRKELSILARLGSGSATRSLWHGFVKWHMGIKASGMDSYGEKIKVKWPELCVGLLIIDKTHKKISSSSAMAQTMLQSKRYKKWPIYANKDCEIIEEAIHKKDIALLGSSAQRNSIAMHACLQDFSPPILYNTPQTDQMMRKVFSLQDNKYDIYFTQDAGPNLILIFLKKDIPLVLNHFPLMKIVFPFSNERYNTNV